MSSKRIYCTVVRNKVARRKINSLNLPLSIERLGNATGGIYSICLSSKNFHLPSMSTLTILNLGIILRRAFWLAYSLRVPGELSHWSRYTATMPGSQIKSMADEPQAPTSANLPSPPKRRKLTGRAFYESLGSPKMILAPMVDQSEFVRCFIRPLWLRTALTRRLRPGACLPGPS